MCPPAGPGSVGRVSDLPPPLGPAASPADVHRYFAALPAGEQAALAARWPAVVGRLDGAPPALRYAANRLLMRTTPYRDWTGRYLLFDPRGRGRVALVHGELAGADRVAVLVPGASTRAATFVCGHGGRAYRAPAVQAANLYRAARALRPDTRIAVIAWLGYRTPAGPGLAAARPGLAVRGAAALVRLVAGLAVGCPRATVAVLGHSYGSVVVGLAAHRLPGSVRDIAVFGSPGMGVDRVADLGTAATVWAALAPGDWVRRLPKGRLLGLGHGRDPADPAFGARPLPSSGVAGHDHYLSPGTGSLAALAAVVAGLHPAAVTSPSS
jgi:hypothetical protein